MAEHVTREKKVLALSAKNKLCICPPDNGREEIQASNHADHCSASLSISQIGMWRGGGICTLQVRCPVPVSRFAVSVDKHGLNQ
jgi:hypothetical protein